MEVRREPRDIFSRGPRDCGICNLQCCVRVLLTGVGLGLCLVFGSFRFPFLFWASGCELHWSRAVHNHTLQRKVRVHCLRAQPMLLPDGRCIEVHTAGYEHAAGTAGGVIWPCQRVRGRSAAG